MPGAGFVVVEAKLVPGGLEAVLDRPALPFDGHQCIDAGPGRAPGGEAGILAVRDGAPGQQTAGPEPTLAAVVFVGLEVGQFEIGPVIEPRALGALARGQALPGWSIEVLRDVLGSPGHHGLADPGSELVGGADTEH